MAKSVVHSDGKDTTYSNVCNREEYIQQKTVEVKEEKVKKNG